MKILFISLGCDKNLVDTEVMLGLLASRGYQMTDDESEADIIVINTCCFIHDAKEESIQNILEMAEYKKDGSLKALVVTGCLAERYRQEILDEIPEVDAVLGTTSYDKILEAVDGALKGKHSVTMSDINGIPDVEAKRLVTTGGHFAYLKIAEGCDKHCTYCIIPKIRGNFRSVPMEKLITEAIDLGGRGDDTLRHRYLRRKVAASSVKRAVQNTGNPLDPDTLLLSGGDYGRTDSGHEGGREDMPLPGSSDSARQ